MLQFMLQVVRVELRDYGPFQKIQYLMDCCGETSILREREERREEVVLEQKNS